MKIVTDEYMLRKRCTEVTDFAGLDKVVSVLSDVLLNYNGPAGKALGLAANQLGYQQRMFVLRMPVGPPVCIVNPVIWKQKGYQIGSERCLSLLGVTVRVKRPLSVVIKGVNQYGNHVKYKMSNQMARVICHEIDHLDGKLITDYKVKGG